jgi:dCTP deaminase
MAILSNNEIESYIEQGLIKINPYESEKVQAATIDLRLNNKFLIPREYGSGIKNGYITLKDDFPVDEIQEDEIIILPHNFILGSTLERIVLPNFLSARVDGKSRIARKGLIIQGAGHVGPGFEGEITLEIYNQRNVPIKLRYGEDICQIELHELSSPSTKSYSGKYKGQIGPKI